MRKKKIVLASNIQIKQAMRLQAVATSCASSEAGIAGGKDEATGEPMAKRAAIVEASVESTSSGSSEHLIRRKRPRTGE